MVLIANSSFMIDGGAPRDNMLFFTNLVEWLTLGDNLISIRAKDVAERPIDPTLSEGAKSTVSIFNMVVMPGLIIAFGVFMFLRRRNRQKQEAGK